MFSFCRELKIAKKDDSIYIAVTEEGKAAGKFERSGNSVPKKSCLDAVENPTVYFAI